MRDAIKPPAKVAVHIDPERIAGERLGSREISPHLIPADLLPDAAPRVIAGDTGKAAHNPDHLLVDPPGDGLQAVYAVNMRERRRLLGLRPLRIETVIPTTGKGFANGRFSGGMAVADKSAWGRATAGIPIGPRPWRLEQG